MNGGDPDRWSAVADDWAELWGDLTEPVWRAVVGASGIGSGDTVLDVGCGSGEFLAFLAGLEASTAGVDPAHRMVEVARRRVPDGDVRQGVAERLPWPDATFDLVTSVNALQFAENTSRALAELVRVTKLEGAIAVANWAEAARNDLSFVENAVDLVMSADTPPDGVLRFSGGLEDLLTGGGLAIVSAALVEATWHAIDDDALVRGVLLGEGTAVTTARTPVVIAAASRYRTTTGGYHLVNAFRYAIGRKSIPADNCHRMTS